MRTTTIRINSLIYEQLRVIIVRAWLNSHVASVKRDVGGDPDTYAVWFPNLHIERMSLKGLVRLAYGVTNLQITGGPGWIDSERYNIDAKAESHPGANQQYVALQRRMLQTLLSNRFHLAIHRETRELPVYELTLAKGGPKLQPATCIQRVSGDTTLV